MYSVGYKNPTVTYKIEENQDWYIFRNDGYFLFGYSSPEKEGETKKEKKARINNFYESVKNKLYEKKRYIYIDLEYKFEYLKRKGHQLFMIPFLIDGKLDFHFTFRDKYGEVDFDNTEYDLVSNILEKFW